MHLTFAPWNPKSTYSDKAPHMGGRTTTNIPDGGKSKSTRTGGRYEFFGTRTPNTVPNTIPNAIPPIAAEKNVIKSIGNDAGEGGHLDMDMDKGIVVAKNKTIAFRTKSAASQEHFRAGVGPHENEIVITLSYSACLWGALVATIIVNVLITIILFFILSRLSI